MGKEDKLDNICCLEHNCILSQNLRRSQDEYRIMDRTRIIGRHVFDGWNTEDIPDCQGEGTTALGKGSLGCFRPLRGNLGTARRTGTYSAAGNWRRPLADGSRSHRFDGYSVAGNFFSPFAEEGI